MNLYDFAVTMDLAAFGTHFYMLDMKMPFELKRTSKDIHIFNDRYGVSPKVIDNGCLYFSQDELRQFFMSAKNEDDLDCLNKGP